VCNRRIGWCSLTIKENSADCIKCVLLALCIALTTGCARVYLTVPPTPVSHNHILCRNDVNGVSTWAILPESYNAQNATPWVIYDHGFGETIDIITANYPQSAFVESLATAGFVVVASEYRNVACWGNMDCDEDIANLETLWRSQLTLWPQPFVIGESMGGIVTWNAIAHGVLKPLAAVGIYPACNLANMYSRKVFAPTIQSAYGFTSTAGYSAATKGSDPMLDPPSIFADIPILIWASRSDTVVRRSQNEDPFADAINAAGGSVTINTSRGRHGDPSNFDAPAVISFFSLHLH
jgi:alpha-beta hydrolase superfamily lysophospholipase